MVDRLTPERRSALMSRVRGRIPRRNWWCASSRSRGWVSISVAPKGLARQARYVIPVPAQGNFRSWMLLAQQTPASAPTSRPRRGRLSAYCGINACCDGSASLFTATSARTRGTNMDQFADDRASALRIPLITVRRDYQTRSAISYRLTSRRPDVSVGKPAADIG
jgi:hypothetical protein